MNSVAATLRRHKLVFRDADLRVWLDAFVKAQRKKFGPQPGRTRAAAGPHLLSTRAALGPQPGRTRAAASRANKVPLVSNSPDSLRSSDESISVREAPKTPASARKSAEPDTSWVQPLVEATRAVGKVAISELGPDGRLVLARYHCLKFGNCTKSEGANLRAATKVAAGLGGMSHSATYGSITVAEYVGYAKKVHAGRDKAPWFDVWLIRSVVEFAKAGAA